MSCVIWWNECTNPECNYVSYDPHKKGTCDKCGSANTSTKEWDEEKDHGTNKK